MISVKTELYSLWEGQGREKLSIDASCSKTIPWVLKSRVMSPLLNFKLRIGNGQCPRQQTNLTSLAS